METTERNYGIDLLRLVLMFMVCMLHTLGQGGVLSTNPAGSVGHKVFWFLEILSYCAVDGFALISGYMAKDRPQKYEKIVEMWFQVFFYSFVLTLIFTVAGVNEIWTTDDIVSCLLPVWSRKFWYFTAYFAAFFAAPVLNKFIFAIDEITAKKAFLVIIVMFSVMSLMKDPFRTGSGYSAIWLIVLYLLGGLAKRIRLFERVSSLSLCILWALYILLTWGARVFLDNKLLVNYVSPTILLSGLIMVVLFSRIKLKGKIIAKLSPLAFGVYLFQLNQVIWKEYLKGAFKFVSKQNLFVGIPLVFACAALLFVCGLAVEFVRSRLAKLCRIPALSKKIVSLADKVLTKVVPFLQ